MNKMIESLRNEIDFIDAEILVLISTRMEVVRKIGKIKKEKGISILDTSRWEQLLHNNFNKGEKLGLSKEFIQEILNTIHKYSIKLQEKI